MFDCLSTFTDSLIPLTTGCWMERVCDEPGRRWHLSVSLTLLCSYPPGQVRRKEKRSHSASTPLSSLQQRKPFGGDHWSMIH